MCISETTTSLVWLTLLIVPAQAQAEPGQTFSAKVIELTDRDTSALRQSDGQSVTIGLFCTDAPESTQAYGPKATSAAGSCVLQKSVPADVDNLGRNGRVGARIELGGRDLGATIIGDGLARNSE